MPAVFEIDTAGVSIRTFLGPEIASIRVNPYLGRSHRLLWTNLRRRETKGCKSTS
jgi:hypothetical protein